VGERKKRFPVFVGSGCLVAWVLFLFNYYFAVLAFIFRKAVLLKTMDITENGELARRGSLPRPFHFTLC
jgi:hypothetical protein